MPQSRPCGRLLVTVLGIALATAALPAATPTAATSATAGPVAQPTATAPADEPTAVAIFDAVTVVGRKVDERLGEVPGSVRQIDRTELDLHQVQNLGDVVRYEPGVTATGEAGRFGIGGLRLRGLDGARVALSVDGIAAPSGFAVGSFSSASRDVVAPEVARDIAILRGPTSTLYGSDALAGVVLVRTLRASHFLDSGNKRSVRLGHDGRDHGSRGSLRGAFTLGPWRTLGLATARRAHERNNVGAVDPDPADSRASAALLTLERDFTWGRLDLVAEHQDTTTHTTVDHLEYGRVPFNTTNRLEADDRNRHRRLSLHGHRADPAQPALSLLGLLSWADDGTRQDTLQQRDPEPRNHAGSLRERQFRYDEERLVGEVSANYLFALGAGNHELGAGVATQRVDLAEWRGGAEIDLASGASTSVLLGEVLPVRDFPLSRSAATGAWLVEKFSWHNWSAQVALRYDHVTTNATADALYREDFPTTPVVDSSHQAWTPRLAIGWQASASNSFYVQFAEAFRAPPVQDVNVGLRFPILAYEAIPNPDLQPEQSRGYELGWRLAHRRVGLQLAAYNNRYDDLIESRVNLGRDPATGWTTFQSINRAHAEIRGLEGRVRIHLSRPGSAGSQWILDGGFAFAEGRDLDQRTPLATVDPHRGTIGLGWTAPGGRATASLIATFTATAEATSATAFRTPAASVVDLHSSWNLTPRLRLFASLTNIANTQHWSHGRSSRLLARDPDLEFATEPGRAVVVGVDFRF